MIKSRIHYAIVLTRFSYGLVKLLLIILLLKGTVAYAQVGVHTDFPDNSSAMDIYATNKGLLIPRVILTSNLSSPSPVTSPATGLLVFNPGPNQPVGFYYWDGTHWVSLSGGSASGEYWSLYGNSSTEVGTHFIGTTDDEDFALYTDESERMRITAAGNVVIGATAPYYSSDLFTVVGKPGLDYTVNAYSPYVGFYTESGRTGYYSDGGRYGFLSVLDTVNGYAVYARNYDPGGYGITGIGSGYAGAVLTNHSSGLIGVGSDGIFTLSRNAIGSGIIAIGSNGDTAFTSPLGTGGAFTGYHGVFSRARNSSGTGIISSGNNLVPVNLATGSGGAFTGNTAGLAAWATNATTGTGIIGSGNNQASVTTLSTGSGGAFTGYHGAFGKGVDANGIGVIGLGSNGTDFAALTNGCGGAFTGYHGAYGYGANVAAGTGVIGLGNNIQTGPVLLATGSGGAFTGTLCGVYGHATNSSGDRYGGYFASGGGLYAYVGGRYSNTNRKIVGTGTVGTIVKNTQGEIVTLVCPEAPESLFMDYGIGQLVDGKAHITIDPDLAININVSDKHPLKVFITPEGDCNGVFITNKSANGFDVIELQGGKSNVNFSWQIVATRANEEYTLKDGSVEISDYSKRFQPAPPKLEMLEPQGQFIPYGTDGPDEQFNMISEKVIQSSEASAVKEIEDPDDKD